MMVRLYEKAECSAAALLLLLHQKLCATKNEHSCRVPASLHCAACCIALQPKFTACARGNTRSPLTVIRKHDRQGSQAVCCVA